MIVERGDAVGRQRPERARHAAGQREEVVGRELAGGHPQLVDLARHLGGRIEHRGGLGEGRQQRLGDLRRDRVALAREAPPVDVDADHRHQQGDHRQRGRQLQARERGTVEAPGHDLEIELAEVEARLERAAGERVEGQRRGAGNRVGLGGRRDRGELRLGTGRAELVQLERAARGQRGQRRAGRGGRRGEALAERAAGDRQFHARRGRDRQRLVHRHRFDARHDGSDDRCARRLAIAHFRRVLGRDHGGLAEARAVLAGQGRLGGGRERGAGRLRQAARRRHRADRAMAGGGEGLDGEAEPLAIDHRQHAPAVGQRDRVDGDIWQACASWIT